MPLQQPKSLLELADQITGARLAAADTSLWSISASVVDRARLAINDAIQTHKYYVREIEQTIQLPYGVSLVAVPPNTERITRIGIWDASMVAVTNVTDYVHIPTPQTNLVKVNVQHSILNTPRWIELEYEARVTELPQNISLNTNIDNNTTEITFSTDYVPRLFGNWPHRGYFQFGGLSNSVAGVKEVVYYGSLSSTAGFVDAVRGVMGTLPRAWTITDSVYISPVLVAPPEAYATIMAEAEANMFAYWVGHRAQYDKFVTLAGQQALAVEDILAVVRTLELRAERRYRKSRKAPSVTRAQVRSRNDPST